MHVTWELPQIVYVNRHSTTTDQLPVAKPDSSIDLALFHIQQSGLFDLFQKLHEKLYHQPNTLNNHELSPEVASNLIL